MTLKIIYDHQILSGQKYGGISRYYYEIANRIAAVGNKVEIFAPLYVNKYFSNNCRVRPWGIRIPRFPNSATIIRLFNAAILRLLMRSRWKGDIFHETYYSMADLCPRSAKRVITVYDMIHEKFADNFSRWDKTKKVKAHAVRRADHVICISENTRQDLIALLGVPEEKTSVVYMGCSLSTEKGATKPTAAAKPFILYVGSRVEGYKNFERLLRAYGRSRLLKNDFPMVCFGGGGFSARELALAASLNISQDRIMYMSGNDDILAGLYASATVFVCPSLYEGFGIPTLEAMSFGCPVVCSNTSSLPEVVGDAAELFDPTDEAAMCATIEKVVSSPERTQLLVDRGYKRIKQFSWEKCANDTLNVYEKLLHG